MSTTTYVHHRLLFRVQRPEIEIKFLVKNLLFPSLLPAGHLGEMPAVLILRCVHLEELPHPLPGAGLSGSCLPCETSVPWQCFPPRHEENNKGGGQNSSSGVSSLH